MAIATWDARLQGVRMPANIIGKKSKKQIGVIGKKDKEIKYGRRR